MDSISMAGSIFPTYIPNVLHILKARLKLITQVFARKKGWILGFVLTFVLPFFTHRRGPLLRVKEQVDTVLEKAEEIVDVVEMVAEKLDKVAEDIAHDLPEGGALRHAADFVEDLADTVAKDAHLAAQFIDKVEELEEKLESSFMEPTIHHQDNEAAEEDNEEVVVARQKIKREQNNNI